MISKSECKALLNDWDKTTKKIRHQAELKETGPISNSKLVKYLTEELEKYLDIDAERINNILMKAIIDLRREGRL